MRNTRKGKYEDTNEDSAPDPLYLLRTSIYSRGDINVFYLVRPGPSSFAFFSRKKVGSREFFWPKGQKIFLGVNIRCRKEFARVFRKKCRIWQFF